MKINELKQKPVEGTWVCEGSCEHDHKAWLSLSLADFNGMSGQLNEMTYRDLLNGADPNFLNQKFRADVLTGIQYMGFDDDTMQFLIHSSKYSDNSIDYIVSIKFMQWDEIGQDQEMIPIDRARLLLYYSDIKINCTDPSFLYFYQYILTQLDASIYPEDRFPKRNNAGLKGTMCKHCLRVLKVLGFYNAEIAMEISKVHGGPTTGIQAAINRRERIAKTAEKDSVRPE